MQFKSKEVRKNNPFANIKMKSLAEVEQQGLTAKQLQSSPSAPQSSG